MSEDPIVPVLAERLDTIDEALSEIHRQTKATNGRVSELEIKERIRQDREEQKAIRDAASEATKWRMEQEENLHDEKVSNRKMRRLTLIAAGVGASPAIVVEIARWISVGHP